jgi:hypothetical protein
MGALNEAGAGVEDGAGAAAGFSSEHPAARKASAAIATIPRFVRIHPQ